MRRFALTLRLILSFTAVTTVIGVGSYSFMTYLTHRQFTAIQVAGLSGQQGTIKEKVYFDELVDRGVNRAALKKFYEAKEINENGFSIRESGVEKLLLVSKLSDGTFEVQERRAGVLGLASETFFPFILFLVFLVLGSIVALVIVVRLALNPLIHLRRTTEDILAGKFEVKLVYSAKDELGQTFQALKTLCHELEKRDSALEKVSELATRDGLTGLKNHRSFKEEIKRQLELASRSKSDLGLIILDIDHFKKFNDTYGHQAGDDVLRYVAKSLQGALRESDFLARYGGEEFVVVLPNTDKEGVEIAGENLRLSLENGKIPLTSDQGKTVSVTASFGGLALPAGSVGIQPEDLSYTQYVEECDQNLYKAKKAGRNRVLVSEYQGNPKT